MEPNFISFNCRGLANPLKLTSLISKLNVNQDVIGFQETKINQLPNMHLNILQSHNASYYTQPCDKNRSGGLVTIHPKNAYSKLIFQNENFQIALIKKEQKTRVFINLYLRPSLKLTQISQVLDEIESF